MKAGRKGYKKTIGAVARQLAEAAFYFLTKEEMIGIDLQGNQDEPA